MDRVISRSNLGSVLVFAVSLATSAGAQPPVLSDPVPGDSGESPLAALLPAPVIPVVPVGMPVNMAPSPGLDTSNRILGVIPDFQTVRDPNAAFVPLTPKQKWSLAFKENVDPFNIASAAMAAGFSQMGNQTPKYGKGGPAYGKRFGAALADFGTQNIFSAGLLANVLHQDPRYYRKGPGTGVVKRVVYSVSRIVIARQDSGAQAFNASGVFGTMMGIAASNVYYPAASRRGSVMLGRVNSSFSGGIMGNLMSEFWPDLESLQKRFLHRKPAVKD
jgi:hypothetical protein